jgi:hypothetical protein
MISWVCLTIGSRFRPEPSWIDRLGRAIAVYWLLTGIIVLGAYLMPYYPGFRARVLDQNQTSGPTPAPGASPTED